jgi:dCMP deaminase
MADENVFFAEEEAGDAQRQKWDRRFLKMAALISTWSKDPSTKCGAVIVDYQHRIISMGYNGFARGVSDSTASLAVREDKYEMIHAETNAVLFARQDLNGCTIYTHPFQPCSRCAAVLIQAGIERVVSLNTAPDRWKHSFDIALKMYENARVGLDLYDA